MSYTIPSEEQPTPHIDKGKGRALESTERTPLLASPSQSFSPPDDSPAALLGRRRLWSKLARVFLLSLCFCIIALVIIALLAWSYAAQASDVSPDDVLNKALVYRGPDHIDVLSVDWDGGIRVKVDGQIGLDAGALVGLNTDGDDGFWRESWKSMGRWGVGRLDRVSVNLSTITITSGRNPSIILATVETSPLELPLTTNPPQDTSWLTNISTPLLIHPTHHTSDLVQFMKESWQDGTISVQAMVGEVAVHGGSLYENSWRRNLQAQRSNIKTLLHIQIPPIPGIPAPGPKTPFPQISQLVTLQDFSISTESNSLFLRARATIIDPAPTTINFTSPSIPFVISLLGDSALDAPVPVASVRTQPFSLTHPNITLFISGTVLPLPSTSTNTLSTFLTRYLSAQSNPIIITTPMIPGLSVDTLFPAPDPRPQILRDVTIRDMKIIPVGRTFLASGTVFARVVLPAGMNVGLDVNRVFPDVLVFDGEVPDDWPDATSLKKTILPPPSHLPDPLPERAFGHLRPSDWLPAESMSDDSQGGEGSAYIVTAKIVEVPLEVLPGRQKEFSDFVGKVIFGKGALAGIQGTAAVGVDIHGLPLPDGAGTEMELSGLPFRGSVRVGKNSLLMDNVADLL